MRLYTIRFTTPGCDDRFVVNDWPAESEHDAIQRFMAADRHAVDVTATPLVDDGQDDDSDDPTSVMWSPAKDTLDLARALGVRGI